jgi:hypothetical protein
MTANGGMSICFAEEAEADKFRARFGGERFNLGSRQGRELGALE